MVDKHPKVGRVEPVGCIFLLCDVSVLLQMTHFTVDNR